MINRFLSISTYIIIAENFACKITIDLQELYFCKKRKSIDNLHFFSNNFQLLTKLVFIPS